MKKRSARAVRGLRGSTASGWPCILRLRLEGMRCSDPFDRHEGAARVREFVDAVSRDKQVILTDGAPARDADGKIIGFDRSGYIAVFRVDDIHHDPTTGLSMNLVERLVDLK